MNSLSNAALNQYQQTSNSAIPFSDPHGLILRMLDGAIERIFQAKGAILQNKTAEKGKLIGKAMGIIGGLDACLNRDMDSELVGNLASLYEYINMCLLDANVRDDPDRLDEAAKLIGDIRSAWIQIPADAKAHQPAEG